MRTFLAIASACLASLAVLLLATTRAGGTLLLAALAAAGGHASLQQIAQTQAIVLLGGRTARVHSAARLQRATGLPILVSGMGTGDSGFRAESEKMADILRRQYGIEPRWVEASSIDTEENAIFSWCIVADEGIRRIALVTDPSHMLRARMLFQSVGFQVVPAPAAMPPQPPLAWRDLVPGRQGRRMVEHALKEWVGAAAMRLEWFRHRHPNCPGTGPG